MEVSSTYCRLPERSRENDKLGQAATKMALTSLKRSWEQSLRRAQAGMPSMPALTALITAIT